VTEDVRHASEVSSIGVAYKDVAFKVSSFTEPEGVSVVGSIVVDVDVGVRSVLPVHTHKSGGLLATRDNDGDSSVKRSLTSDRVAGKILIVEIVRNVSLSVFKEKLSGSFSKTIKGIGGEGKVSSDVFIELKALLSINFEHYFFSIVGSGVEGDLVGVEIDNNLDLNFSELDFSRVTVYSGLALKGVGSQIGRLLDKFKGELRRMEGVDAVELNNTVLEEVKFHGGVLVAVSAKIHR